jgi:hypothetical protein
MSISILHLEDDCLVGYTQMIHFPGSRLCLKVFRMTFQIGKDRPTILDSLNRFLDLIFRAG